MPEDGVGFDILVKGSPYESLDGNPFAVPVQFGGDHLSHLHAPEEDRRGGVERADVGGMQHELASRHVQGDGGRRFQPDEFILAFRRCAGVNADVGASDQRAEPGNIAARDPGAHHPETGVLHQQPPGILRQLGGHHHMGAVLGNGKPFDLADLHVLVLQLGLARLHPFSGLESNGDGLAAIHVGFDRQ